MDFEVRITLAEDPNNNLAAHINLHGIVANARTHTHKSLALIAWV